MELTLLLKLTTVKADSEEVFDLQEGFFTVYNTATMRGSSLYRSYLVHLGGKILAAAKEEADETRRVVKLEQLRTMSSVLDPHTNQTVEDALVLFNPDTPMPERAEYLALDARNGSDLQIAVKTAIDFDPRGTTGCIARLFMEVPSGFGETTVATFREACNAIHEAGVGGEITSKLSQQVAVFVFGGLHPTAKPQAADDAIMHAVLGVRIDCTPPKDALAPDPSALVNGDESYQPEAFKRCSQFLRGYKKEELPTWYVEWQAEMEKMATKKAKADKEKADKEKEEKAEAALATGRGLTENDVEEMGGGGVAAAKKESRTTFEVGDDVLVPGKRGKNQPKLKGRIHSILTNDCYVMFDSSVDVPKNPGKYKKDKIVFDVEQTELSRMEEEQPANAASLPANAAIGLADPPANAASLPAKTAATDSTNVDGKEKLDDGKASKDDSAEPPRKTWLNSSDVFADED